MNIYGCSSGEEDGAIGEEIDSEQDEDREGAEYKWFEGVSKTTAFAFSDCDDFCRNIAFHGRKDVEIESGEIESHGTTDGNICNWVWHLGCLDPPITAAQGCKGCILACTALNVSKRFRGR